MRQSGILAPQKTWWAESKTWDQRSLAAAAAEFQDIRGGRQRVGSERVGKGQDKKKTFWK